MDFNKLPSTANVGKVQRARPRCGTPPLHVVPPVRKGKRGMHSSFVMSQHLGSASCNCLATRSKRTTCTTCRIADVHVSRVECITHEQSRHQGRTATFTVGLGTWGPRETMGNGRGQGQSIVDVGWRRRELSLYCIRKWQVVTSSEGNPQSPRPSASTPSLVPPFFLSLHRNS